MSYESEVLADSPLFYARLDELSGTTMFDSSVSNNDGTYSPAPVLGGTNSPSTLGSTAAWFTSFYSHKAFAAPTFIGNVFTLEGWFRLSDLADNTYRIIVNAPAELRVNPGNTLQLVNPGVSETCTATVAITDTDWHHAAATKNGATVKLYLDGVDVTGSVTNSTYSSTGSTRIAYDLDGFLFNGGLSDIAIYQTALSLARITAHLAAANGVPSDPPEPPSGHPLNTQPPFLVPTDYTSIHSQMVFYPGDSVVLTLDKQTATDYTVRDYDGTVVASGAVTSTTLDLGTAFGLGWYRVYLTGPTTGPNFDLAHGVYEFVVVRDNPAFPTYPPDAYLQTDPLWHVAGGEARDPITKSVFGMGSSRLQISNTNLTDPGDPYLPGSIGNQQGIDSLYACILGAQGQLLWRPDDPARTWPLMCQFPNGATDHIAFGDYFQYVFCKDGTLDGSQVFVSTGPGSVSGGKIVVHYPDAVTVVETYDNQANANAAKTAINAASDYIWVGGANNVSIPTTAATAVGNSYWDGLTNAVQALVPEGVLHYEGPQNEPGFGDVTAHASRIFADCVHAAHPDAVAQGPCFVTASSPINLRNFFDFCIADGGGFPMDEISIHFYNSQPFGDFGVGRQTMQDFNDVLVEYGLDDLPVWNTESLSEDVNQGGIYQPRFSKIPLSMVILMEQYGVPRERNQYWYDASHGFWSIATFFRFGDLSVQPFAPMFRVLEEETLGMLYDHLIDFGSVQANSLYIGSVYSPTDAGDSCAVVQARCILDDQTITFGVTGGLSELEVVDAFGRETTVSVTGGYATVQMDEIPTYIRVPFGSSIWVHKVHDWPVNDWTDSPPASIAQLGRGQLSGSQSTQIVADGEFYSNELFGTGIVVSVEDLPDFVDVSWSETVNVDRVIIVGYGVSLTDFDIQTTTDGVNFTTRKTVDIASDVDDVTFWHPTTGSNSGTSWESYWDNRWAYDIKLPATYAATGVRVYVRDSTYRGAPTAEISLSGYGYAPGTRHLGIQEIVVPSASAPDPFSGGYDDLILATSGLVGFWKFNEIDGGTTVPSEVNSPTLDGVLGTNVVRTTSGPVSDGTGSFSLYGGGTMMTVPFNALLNVGDTFTVEAWVNTRGLTGAWGGEFCRRHFSVEIGGSGFNLSNLSTRACETSVGIVDGNWHHVVITKSGATSKIYIDAVDLTVPVNAATCVNNTGALTVSVGTGAEQWYGRFAYYSTALTPTEVANHFHAASVITVPPALNDSYVDPTPHVYGSRLISGSQVASTTGYWLVAPNRYSFQWQDSLNGSTVHSTRVGEIRSDIMFDDGDIGLYFRVGVVASNTAGDSDVVYSEWVGPIGAAPIVPPVNTVPPVVSGDGDVGSVLSATSGTWTHTPTSYHYQWQSSPDGDAWEDVTGETDAEIILTPGDEGMFFRVTVAAENEGGVSDIAYSEPVGPVTPAPPPSEDPMAPCTPWITGDDVADCCSVEVSSGVVFDAVAEMAGDLLFSISGRLFAGECSRTVRPACDECYCGYQVLSRGYVIGPWDYGYPLMLCDSCLTACDPSLVKLAGYPVREITEVKIGGDVVDPADYRVFNGRYLQRLDSERWPRSQNLTLPDTEDNTFSITYSFGASPPALGVAAAAQLGCELYKACSSNNECSLPSGTVRYTRQGVTVDKLAFTSWGFRDGRWATGLALVDAFLGSVNPSGLQRRPTVWAPGKRQYAQPWG